MLSFRMKETRSINELILNLNRFLNKYKVNKYKVIQRGVQNKFYLKGIATRFKSLLSV